MVRLLPLLLCVSCLVTTSVRAQDAGPQIISAGSIGLRTGFDSNPTDTLGARGSFFVNETASYDYLRGSLADDGLGVKLSFSDTNFDPNVAAASTTVLLAVTKATPLGDNLDLRTTLTTTVDDNWARRYHSAQLRNRFEYNTSDIRLFTNLDTNLSSLNERNIFTQGGFLPEDENFITVSAMPGFAWKFNGGEAGASVAATRVAYLAPDIFGFDRSHSVIQPNAFFNAKFGNWDLEGSLSPFYAAYDTNDFGPIAQLLYTGKAKYTQGDWTFGLGSSRTVQDTTLVLASLDLGLSHEASVSYKIDGDNAISLLARYRRDDYLGVADYIGIDLWSRTVLAGIDYAHNFGDGYTGTAGLSVRQVERPGETQPVALNIQIGIQKKLDFGNAPKTAPGDAANKGSSPATRSENETNAISNAAAPGNAGPCLAPAHPDYASVLRYFGIAASAPRIRAQERMPL
jgi:hypothetical protein